ncbi:hypothetical protein RSK20926_09869 [Roseobacter sp. SK209-2-6]|nr:hypothetical protein RSK20926_09869 [Roseobacter sp. SK209-2-6]
MKIGNIFGVVCLLITAGGIYLLLTQKSPREKALAELQNLQMAPETADLNIQLEDCVLDIAIRHQQPTHGNLLNSRMTADLRNYDSKSVNLRALGNGQIALSLLPKPVSNQTLTIAQSFLSKVPEEMRNRKPHTLTMRSTDGRVTQNSSLPTDEEGQMSRVQLRNLLQQPNGKLTFRLGIMVPEAKPGEPPAEPKPHKDAPALHAFVKAVEADAAITGYAFNLIYAETSETPEKLLVGGLEFPAHPQFVLATEDAAKNFAQALLHYIQASCRKPKAR